MKKTDFVDQDLVKGRGSTRKSRKQEKIPVSRDVSDEVDIPIESISDYSLGRMARHKEDVNSSMVNAINEMELLRRRQQELEQERSSLEDISQKQEEYERGKFEMIEHLNQGIIALEKKEVQSAQLTELLVATKNRFKETLEEIHSIDEEQWINEHFREELYKALVIVDDARMEYNKALAKIEVLEGNSESMLERRPMVAGDYSHTGDEKKSFGYWVKVGFAVTLPVMILIAALLAGYLALFFFSWI